MNKRRIGEQYEDLAARFLEEKGYHILARNWHAGKLGELDIIARDGVTLIFVEVKYRSINSYGSPFDAIDARKQARIGKLAQCYMKYLRIPFNTPCRFDCIGITGDGRITHIPNAFGL